MPNLKEINAVVENTAAKSKFSKNSSIEIKNYLLNKNEKKLYKQDNFIILTEKEMDNGMNMSVMQDFDDAGAFGDAKITFGNVGGLVDIYVGTDGSELDAIDDITPSAFEEANGSGSGTYQDVGGLAAEMGIGFKASLPILGTVSGQYVPKADGSESGDKTASGSGTTTEEQEDKLKKKCDIPKSKISARVVCDYIASMTDRSAVENHAILYGKDIMDQPGY